MTTNTLTIVLLSMKMMSMLMRRTINIGNNELQALIFNTKFQEFLSLCINFSLRNKIIWAQLAYKGVSIAVINMMLQPTFGELTSKMVIFTSVMRSDKAMVSSMLSMKRVESMHYFYWAYSSGAS